MYFFICCRLQLAEFHTKEYIATLESYEAKGSSLLDSEVMRKHGLGK